MLAESMPPCLCGSRNFDGGGGSFGSFSQTNWHCADCGRAIMHLHCTFGIVLMDAEPAADEKSRGKAPVEYANKVLFPFWRAEAEKTYYGMSLRDCWDKKLPVPDPLPPALPREVAAFLLAGRAEDFPGVSTAQKLLWRRVDHAASALVPIPKDPIRVHHDEFWADVIKTLDLPPVTEVPNDYYRDENNCEPWYICEVEGAKLRFGPRKRVFSITVTRDRAFSVAGIAAAAKADGVSYWAEDRESPDQRSLAGGPGWHAWGAPRATEMTVHAWDREKLLAYFRLVLEGLSEPPAGLREAVRDGVRDGLAPLRELRRQHDEAAGEGARSRGTVAEDLSQSRILKDAERCATDPAHSTEESP